MTVIVFLLVLAVLIFVHELGHFLVARAFGIRVEAFALGFGPKIISWQGKETKYSLNIIPFGGYVKIFGENPDEESISGPDSKRSFANKPRWQQALVLVAGVFFNLAFAGLLYISIFTFGVTADTQSFSKYADRLENSRIMITSVSPDSPAKRAGLEVGDSLGSNQTIDDIQKLINSSQGKPISLEYSRQGEVRELEIIPETGLVGDRYAIGISMSEVGDLRLPIWLALIEGFRYTILMIKETAVGLALFFGSIFIGQADLSVVTGPVGIAGIVGDAAGLGLASLAMITALISINLGVINLIPFPALDGGRLLFVGIEAVTRRKIPVNFANIVNATGFVLLMLLMILVTYQDIARLWK